MADNISITSGTGVTVATDDDGAAQHQWVKIEIGGNGSFVPITTANGLPVQVLSLPALGVGTIVSVSGLTSASVSVSNGSINVTSLPPFAVGSIISISGLTSAIVSISAGSIMSISGLTSASVSISNGSINITSLPPLGAATVSLSAGSAVTISNLANTPLTVSGTTIALSPHANYFYFSSTYTAALTTGTELKAIVGSTTAYVITDIHFSSGATHGNMSLVYSRPNAAIVTLIPATYFANYAGMVSNLMTPLVCDTNSAIHLYSQTCTSQSVMITGYTI